MPGPGEQASGLGHRRRDQARSAGGACRAGRSRWQGRMATALVARIGRAVEAMRGGIIAADPTISSERAHMPG